MRLFLLLALLTSSALADELVLTWTAPTQREDGTALLPAEIANYRINLVQGTTALPPITVAGTLLTYPVSGLAVGRYCATMQTIDTDGLESVATAPVCRKARPNAPGNLRVR